MRKTDIILVSRQERKGPFSKPTFMLEDNTCLLKELSLFEEKPNLQLLKNFPAFY
jgi:hypothetical protein